MKTPAKKTHSYRVTPWLAAAVCVLALAPLLGACGGDEAASPSPSASAVASSLTTAEQEWLAQKGTLQIGAFNDYPPFGFVDDGGSAAGIAVDYWNLVAERLGVDIKFSPVAFADQLDGLKDGTFDSLEGIFPLEEREQWFDFSRAYFAIDTRIYVEAGHTGRDTLESLKGVEVAVVDGDSGQQLAEEAGLETVVVKGYPQAVKAVASGDAQAMILDEMVADYYIAEFDVASEVKAVGDPVATGEMTMPVRKDDTMLLGILNKGIEMVGESEFEAIYENWTDPEPSPGASATVSEAQVIELVDATSAALEEDAQSTLAAIDAGEAPFVDPEDPALYAFVYDTEVTLVATPDAGVRGQSMKGKADAVGKLFRDEIVAGALADGSGWETYVYKEPDEAGLFRKSTYYKLTTGSDGEQYVVCAGRYLGPYAGSSGAASSSSTAATQADVQAFVEKAVSYAGKHGKDAALAAFTAPGGEFHKGELYVYAYDFDGTVIAHGGDPSLVGENLIDMEDPNGVPVIADLVRLARQGSGWLYFTWPNPENGDREEAKLGYVQKVDDEWFVGSGTYGSAAVEPPSKAKVEAFVGKALRYARRHGKQQAIAEFMKTSGRFFRGQLYIFAYNMKGKALCLPAEPEKVGDDRWDLRDPNGVYSVREIVAKAKHPGKGWVRYQYVDPAQGYQLQEKTSYVHAVDGTWLIGAGTYRPLD